MSTLAIPVRHVWVNLIDDDRICDHVRRKGAFEPDTLKAWAKMCRKGSEVLDVGAYSGLFSIAAAKLGARPVAIEPLPTMVKRIRENAALNGVRVSTLTAAASDQDGEAEITFNPDVYMTAGASFTRKEGSAIKVKTVRLDSLSVMDVSAVKIDVERAEYRVLKAARAMLRKNRPMLLVETLTERARENVETLLSDYRTLDFLDGRNLLMEPG